MGTTRRKAGSAASFRQIDFSLNLKIAEAASKSFDLRVFSLVSSVGASKSSMFLYPKTKGELEFAVSCLPFKCIQIYRPAFLEIDGGRQEFRLGERILGLVAPFLSKFSDSISINVKDLAHAMVVQAAQICSESPKKEKQIFVYENKQILHFLRQEAGK